MLARKPLYQQERRTSEHALGTYKKAHVTTHTSLQSGKSVKQKLSWIFTISVCASLAMFVVSQYAEITKENYQVDQLNQEIRQSNSKNASLQAQSISLSNPQRIIGIALNKLNMQFVDSTLKSN